MEKDIIGCAHEGCDRTVEFCGASPEVIDTMFGGDKLSVTAFVALQSGWDAEFQEDGGAFMYCPDHRGK